MTAFQELVEMPYTGRKPSYAPADFAERVLPVHPKNDEERTMLNWATHFGLGKMWGAAYGLAAHSGLRGTKGVMVVFGAVYTGDVVLNTALGLYKPTTWSKQDWAVDIVDKFVQAAATGWMYDHVFGRQPSGRDDRHHSRGAVGCRCRGCRKRSGGGKRLDNSRLDNSWMATAGRSSIAYAPRRGR